jgi:hypothetical protein
MQDEDEFVLRANICYPSKQLFLHSKYSIQTAGLAHVARCPDDCSKIVRCSTVALTGPRGLLNHSTYKKRSVGTSNKTSSFSYDALCFRTLR